MNHNYRIWPSDLFLEVALAIVVDSVFSSGMRPVISSWRLIRNLIVLCSVACNVAGHSMRTLPDPRPSFEMAEWLKAPDRPKHTNDF